MAVQGQKFVIVGGAGLVGSAMAHTLITDHSVDVVICDRFGDVESQKWANLPANIADIWTPDSLLDNLDKAWRKIAGVMLLVDDGQNQNDGDALFNSAYHLPRRVWDFCVTKQRPMAWASSSHIYGAGPSNLSTKPEDVAVLKPVTAFGRAKQAFDIFAARQGIGPDTPPVWAGLRLSSAYGPQETHKGKLASLPHQAMTAARSGRPLGLWHESAAGARDWVHVDDVATAIAGLAVGHHTGFFDIGTGVLSSTLDLVKQVEATTGRIVNLSVVEPHKSFQPTLTAANILPLAQAGLSVQFRGLEQGLADL